MSGPRIHDGHPGYGDVELPDLNLHQEGDDAEGSPEIIPEPSGQAAEKRPKDLVDPEEEPHAVTDRSSKRPRLEPENSDNEINNASFGPLSEKAKGKRPARSPEPEVFPDSEPDGVQESQPDEPPQTQFDDREQSPTIEPLTAYTCPICFGVVTNATMTPCGHVCCGECLFNAVEASMSRGRFSRDAEGAEARCPVCRARIPGWDGMGGGVIGLVSRTVIAL